VEIFDSDFDFGEVVEDIEFSEIDAGVSIDLVRVAELDEVEPATTTSATGGCAKFVTCFLEMCSDILLCKSWDERGGLH